MTGKNEPMSARKFQLALRKLGLTVASQQTAALLGLSVRQCQRLAAEDQKVPRPVELLLGMYLKHGLPE